MNTVTTPSDALQQLAAHGFDTSRLHATQIGTRPQRCPAPGKGKGNDAGYVYINDHSVVVGDHSTGERIVIRLEPCVTDELSHNENRAANREQQRINRERRKQSEKNQSGESAAQHRAIRIYRAATPVTDADNHNYLKQKRISGAGIERLGLRVDQYKGQNRLIVPVYDPTGKLFTIQTINELGKKRYFRGAGFTGGRYGVGRSPARYPARSASAAIRFDRR